MPIVERTALFVSSILSIVGSSTIIYRFCKGKRWNLTYERMALGLSVSDLLLSLSLVIGLIPVSQPSPFCTFEAFTKHFGLAGPYYNASLSFYYLLVIVFNVKEERMTRIYEPLLHFAALPFALISAMVALSLKVYNPSPPNATCWIHSYPDDCDDRNIVCIRASAKVASLVDLVLVFVPLLFVLVSLIVNNLWIFLYVNRIERRARQHSFRNSLTDTASQAQKVASQSFCFVLAFFLSFVFNAVLEIVGFLDPEGRRDGRYYAIEILQASFYPLQGFFNLLVYLRPRYLRWRKWSNHSRFKCLYEALVKFEAPPAHMMMQAMDRGGEIKAAETTDPETQSKPS